MGRQAGGSHKHTPLPGRLLCCRCPGFRRVCRPPLHPHLSLQSPKSPPGRRETRGTTTCLEYLGILLDSTALEARLPPDKLEDIHQALHRWSARTQCKKQELLSLIGTLSFSAKVVPAGRSFLRRMIDTSTTARTPQETISLPEAFKLHLAWWQAFATPWNGRSFFLLPQGTPPPTSSCSQTAPAPSAMVPTVRDSGLTGRGPRRSCSIASNGRNFTPLCWQPSPGATSGPPFASVSCATIRPWCSAWSLARHTARTSCPSSVTFSLLLPCTISPYLHNTFPVCTTLSLTLFPVSTCRCSANMLQKPCPTHPPSPPPFPSTRHEALPTPLSRHVHTQHIQRSHTQLHHIHSHIQPTPPQRITHAGLGTHTHAIRLISCTHPKATIHKGVPLCSPQHAPGARAPRPHVRRPQPPPLDERNQAGAWVSSGPQTAYHTHHTQLISRLTLWAALLLAFFGFLRSSELLSLRHTNLTRCAEGYQVRIRASKMDPFRIGATVRVTLTGDPSLCPVTVLDSLVSATGQREGSLFRLMNGVCLSRPRLNRLVRELAAHSGAPTNYSSHSFRIGAASAAAAAGIPEWQIQALGRWSTDCYKRYIRLPSSTTDTVAAAIARVPL